MLSKPKECEGCPFFSKGRGYVPPYGRCSNGVMLVGMAPEVNEIVRGVPFVGRAGDALARALRWVPERKENYGIINLVQCQPPDMDLRNNQGWEGAVEHCRVHRQRAEQQWKPDVIVAMGAYALGEYAGVDTIERTRGYVYRKPDCTPVVGTYHPSYVGRGNMQLLFPLRYDLATARSKANGEHGRATLPIRTYLSPAEFERWGSLAARRNELAVDIETPYSTDAEEDERESLSYKIIRVSFGTKEDGACTVVWQEPYVEVAKRLLLSNNDKLLWNSDFDIPRLEHDGARVNGRIVDVMWLWHFLQSDLPKNLAHVSTYYTLLPEWKSLSERDPEYYSACDAYATVENYYGICANLEKTGKLDVAKRHVIDLQQVLIRMKKKGMRIDREKLLALRAQLAARCEKMKAAMQEHAPVEVCAFKTYKRPPKKEHGERGVLAKREGTYLLFSAESGEEWRFVWDFNPASWQQLLRYLKFKKIKVPISRKTKSETTGEKALKRILQKWNDPLVAAILDFRKVDKIRSMTNWPIYDGRVHPKLTQVPATGRLACENPNFQQIPNEGDLAQLVRECLLASEGGELVTGDFIGMESFLTGYFAGDEEYMALADKNIYCYVMARYNKWDMPHLDDPRLPAFLASLKSKDKVAYKKWKSTVLGIGYLEGAAEIVAQNPGVFDSINEAKELKAFYYDTFPKIKTWQDSVIATARKEGRIVNPYGYVRWFLDADTQGPQIAAMLPQSTGAAMIKDDMLALAETEVGHYLVLQIHDELVTDTPRAKIPYVSGMLREVMERSRPEIGGNRIRVVIKRGPSMGGLK